MTFGLVLVSYCPNVVCLANRLKGVGGVRIGEDMPLLNGSDISSKKKPSICLIPICLSLSSFMPDCLRKNHAIAWPTWKDNEQKQKGKKKGN